jgi:hypothetical protein
MIDGHGLSVTPPSGLSAAGVQAQIRVCAAGIHGDIYDCHVNPFIEVGIGGHNWWKSSNNWPFLLLLLLLLLCWCCQWMSRY